MNLRQVGLKAGRHLRSNGVRNTARAGIRHSLQTAYDRSPYHQGRPIYDTEWDAMIVLDACRPDLLAEVTDEYDFLPDEIRTSYSVGSSSPRWHQGNFTETYREEMGRTALVTSNPWSEEILSAADFLLLDEVWRYAWDDDAGTVHPRPITDRAITAGREHSPDRLIAHYMQPHFPSIPDPLGSELDLENWGEKWDGNVWQQLEAGELSRARAWESYRANLRHVLDDVETLLSNLDAERVVVTADHGNAFGEWDVYGHPHDVHLPVLRSVPWVDCSATDTHTHEPALDEPRAQVDTGEEDVQDRLKDLGYLD